MPVSGPERRGRIARRSRWLALAAAATHEPHTIVSASRRRPRGSPRSSASDEGVARNRLPSAEKATSGGPGGQRRPRSGKAHHQCGKAVLQGGEGIAAPLADLAEEKERPRSPKWRCCACRGDLPGASDAVRRWNSSQRRGNIAAGEAGKGRDGPRAHGLGGIAFFPGGRRFGGASGRVCHGGLEGPELTMQLKGQRLARES